MIKEGFMSYLVSLFLLFFTWELIVDYVFVSFSAVAILQSLHHTSITVGH